MAIVLAVFVCVWIGIVARQKSRRRRDEQGELARAKQVLATYDIAVIPEIANTCPGHDEDVTVIFTSGELWNEAFCSRCGDLLDLKRGCPNPNFWKRFREMIEVQVKGEFVESGWESLTRDDVLLAAEERSDAAEREVREALQVLAQYRHVSTSGSTKATEAA